MGEYAEMMLDGTLCECCGGFLDGEAPGFPRYCSNECARDRGATHALPNPVTKPNPDKVNCPTCRKRVKRVGLADHMRDAHQETNMPNRKFVKVKFKAEDTRTYTYVWEGEDLVEGDLVKVADNRSDGWKRVTVVEVTDEEPPFACKPILGKVDHQPEPTPIEQAGAVYALGDNKPIF